MPSVISVRSSVLFAAEGLSAGSNALSLNHHWKVSKPPRAPGGDAELRRIMQADRLVRRLGRDGRLAERWRGQQEAAQRAQASQEVRFRFHRVR